MKIAFDSQIFGIQEYGGVSRYFTSLATHLARMPGIDPKIFAPLHINHYLKTIDERLLVGRHVSYSRTTGKAIRSLSSALSLPMIYAMNPDIVHETYYSALGNYGSNACRILTVYDMIHERLPQGFPLSDNTRKRKAAAIRRADHILCISENTRRDLLEFYQLPENRVSVTHLGHEMPAKAGSSQISPEIGMPFLLYVGGRHGYKNFSCFIRAYSSSIWLKNNFRIICFGGGTLSTQERAMIFHLGNTETQVTHMKGGDDCLAKLYESAAAFVYPSKYEGFGIPPLEAMSLGCPVVCSQTSSIPEVVGNAGEYFDPNDDESLKYSLERVLQSASRQAELVQLGLERCKQFSWERCARETLTVYEKVAPHLK